MNSINQFLNYKDNKSLQQILNNPSNIFENPNKYSLDNNTDIINIYNPDIPLPLYFQITKIIRIKLLLYLFIIHIICNLEKGIYLSNEKIIKNYYNLNNKLLLFGFFNNVGKLIGIIIYTFLINRIPKNKLLIMCMLGRGSFLFSMIWIKDYPYFFMIFLNFFNIFFSIYFPIWCDQYCDSSKKIIMLTIIETGFPLGIFIGYLLGIFYYEKWSELLCLNGLLYFLLIICFLKFDKKYFNMKQPKKIKLYEDDSNSENESFIIRRNYSIVEILDYIFKKKYLIFIVLSLTISFFSLNIFIYYHIDYIKEIYNITLISTEEILFRIINYMFFSLVILFGGILGYSIGIYRDKTWFITSTILSLFSYLSICLLFIINNVFSYYICVSLYLFFFGAKLPLELVIIFKSVHNYIKGETSCILFFFLTLFGYLPSSFVFHFIYNITSMKFTMISCSQFSFFGTCFSFFASYLMLKNQNENTSHVSISDNTDNDLVMIEQVK